jgi:hypothetical protein
LGADQPHLPALILAAAMSLGVLVGPSIRAEEVSQIAVSPDPEPSWWGPVRFGFSIGAPAILNLRLDSEIRDDLELGLAWGGMVVPLPSIQIQQWNVDLAARYFHTGKTFFVGMTLRYLGVGVDGRSILVRSTESVTTEENPEMRLGGLYAVPHVGLRFKVGKKMTLSFDLGLQLPLFTFGSIHSSRLNAPVGSGPTDTFTDIQRASSRPLSWMARTPVPAVSLFALTWDL